MFALIVCTSAFLAVALGAPSGDIVPFVEGGGNASTLQYPYQVSIQTPNLSGTYDHTCGAAIISPTWIITAAHCVTWATTISVFVAGASNLTKNVDEDPNIQIRTVDLFNIIAHPDWNAETKLNDIALIKMSKAFEFNDYVRAVHVSKVPCISDDMAAFTGYGLKLDGDTAEPSAILQDANLTVKAYDDCVGLLNPLLGEENYKYEEDVQTCATGAANPCVLDDGGPLIQYDRLIGVLSWIPAVCGSEDIPTVFTRVGFYSDFIEKHVTDLPSN